jgi:ribosomal protein L11 methyltransferase
MPFLELSFELQRLDSERAEAACFDSGALSVTLSDQRESPPGAPADPTGARRSPHAALPGSVLEPAVGEQPLWPRTRMQALYPAETADARLILSLSLLLEVEPARITVRAVADRAWEREWLRDFHARRFGQRLWICPHHEVAPPDDVCVLLDPGLAFGTGSHPSTAMCLEWLDQQPPVRLEVIDYGCGSGVLAIAALKLGARRAWAYDTDPQALLATRANAEANGVGNQLEVCAQPVQLPDRADLVLANILSETLLTLAPELAARVATGGRALLAGLLESQQAEVAAAYSAWFDMGCYARRDDWVTLRGQRR